MKSLKKKTHKFPCRREHLGKEEIKEIKRKKYVQERF